MRFVCDSCRAQYMISDDKVGAKGVKVQLQEVRPHHPGPSARRCGVEGRRRRPTHSASDAAAAASAGNGAASSNCLAGCRRRWARRPEGGLFTGVEEDEIGAVFDQVLSSGSQKIPRGRVAGETASRPRPRAMRKLAEAEVGAGRAEGRGAANDWFVAIDEKQVGPLTVEKIKEHWDRGEVGPDSLCWRAGFSDWIPLSEATELASVLAPRPAKPVIVAPAAGGGAVALRPRRWSPPSARGRRRRTPAPEIPAAPALGARADVVGLEALGGERAGLAGEGGERRAVQAAAEVRAGGGEVGHGAGLLDLPPEPAVAPAARAVSDAGGHGR